MLLLETRGLKALAALKKESGIVYQTNRLKRPDPRLHSAWLEDFALSYGGRSSLSSQLFAVGVSIAPGNVRAIQSSIDFANVMT
jgi:hypothetical protein